MHNLRELRARIGSLRKTAQITRAMKMVSAVKLRRTQAAMLTTKPYCEQARESLRFLLRSAGARIADSIWLAPSAAHRTILTVISADRGLCGNVNHGVIRRAKRSIAEYTAGANQQVALCLIGRKCADHFRHTLVEYGKDVSIMYASSSAEQSSADLADRLLREYRAAKCDRIVLVYTEFENAIRHRATQMTLLPLANNAKEAPERTVSKYALDVNTIIYATPPLLAPNPAAIMDRLAPLYIRARLSHALLESAAAEHGARMCMMDQAQKKADDLIQQLRLQYNKARHVNIDRELADITAGVEASA